MMKRPLLALLLGLLFLCVPSQAATVMIERISTSIQAGLPGEYAKAEFVFKVTALDADLYVHQTQDASVTVRWVVGAVAVPPVSMVNTVTSASANVNQGYIKILEGHTETLTLTSHFTVSKSSSYRVHFSSFYGTEDPADAGMVYSDPNETWYTDLAVMNGVPEPSSAVLGLIVSLGLLRRRR